MVAEFISGGIYASSLTPLVGENLFLTCTGCGEVKWFFSQSVVAARNDSALQGAGVGPILKLFNVTSKNSGTYICLLQTSVANKTKYFIQEKKIVIIGKALKFNHKFNHIDFLHDKYSSIVDAFKGRVLCLYPETQF